MEPLQLAYVGSEERCKQLVEVTQQWAIECDEKLRYIQMLEKEGEKLRGQLQQQEARVSKYKKFWMENKEAVVSAGKVSDYQFEELRSELACRRELYDQVGGGARDVERGVARGGGKGRGKSGGQ